MDFAKRRAGAPAMDDGGGEINQRPSETGEQAQRAGEIREQKIGLLFPGEDGFDGELGQRLHPRENGEGEALRDEKLRGLRAPGNQQRGKQDAGSGPQGGPRTAFRKRRGDQQQREARKTLS